MKAKLAILTVVVAGAASASDARAAVTLKQVQDEAGKVTLQFDRPIGRNQFQTDYFENTVQLTFQDTHVYPAKIAPIHSLSDVTKVFAYQYSPKVVRCRLTVKGDASAFKSRLQIVRRGKEVVIQMKDEAHDRLTTAASQAVRKPRNDSESDKGLDAEERGLLERILKKDEPAPAAAKPAAAPESKESREAALVGPGFPSPRKALVRLGLLTLVMIGGALVFRWLRRGSSRAADPEKEISRAVERQARSGFWGSLGGSLEKFAKGKLAKARMIEVVSTHYLGPKKSIAVVRVAGKMMVLGISQDSINLITRLDEDGDGADLESILDNAAISSVHGGQSGFAPVGGSGAVAAGGSRFNAVLAREASQPAVASNVSAAAASAAAVPKSRVREQIRERLGGMKPL